ncbi:MAG: hypothetical protein IKV79_02810 [Oscillospiraceae bacterium]|nr:hypothetical protein [Oscillospiraceae bacterium]
MLSLFETIMRGGTMSKLIKYAYKPVCVFLAAIILLGVFSFSLFEVKAEAYVDNSLEYSLSPSVADNQKLRPTSVIAKDMENKKDESKPGDILFLIFGWILVVALLAYGFIHILLPGVATEIHFFWHNLLNMWTRWDSFSWGFKNNLIESSRKKNFLDIILGILYIICAVVIAISLIA